MTRVIAFRQIVVAVLATTVLTLAIGVPADRRTPLDELINRPASPFACGPGEPFCEHM